MLFSIPLEGQWSFALDPTGKGEAEAWHVCGLNDTITLPGSVDEAAKTPLTTTRTMAHLSRRHPYVGKAWYGRSFCVPEGLEDHFFTIALERPHGEVNIWLDGYKLGRDESLSTAVRMMAGPLSAGEHRVVMMIDNGRFEAVGDAIVRDSAMMKAVAHSTTDHTQTNWNGVVGYLRVEAARASISRLDVRSPDRHVTVSVELDAFDPDNRFPTFWTAPHDDQLVLEFALDGVADPVVIRTPLTISSGFTPVTVAVDLPDEAGLWDEFSPIVHRLTARWMRDGDELDRRSTSFGIRSFVRDGRRLTLNGRPVFLRGTLDCCIFPLTGYPPTGPEGWEKVFLTAKAYGLNHIRYHSYCPPEAAFEVADRLGMLLHVETPVWPMLGADPALDRYIHVEAERIVASYGNHPSFVMFCVGNEVNGAGVHAFLERFIADWHARDDRRVYTGGSGWPTIERADYISKPEPRNQRWGEGLDGRLNARPLETRTDWSDWVASVPMALVSHETGQWCVYPDLTEVSKYGGVLEARNLLMVREDLAAKGRGALARRMMLASGALQTQLYKEEIEAALRTPEMAGTQLLGLQDFPGQGTALVGVVDAFWDPKPYVDAAEFREFCAPVVPLLRAGGFVKTVGERFVATVQLAQFGPTALDGATINWQLLDDRGAVQREGRIDGGRLDTGCLHTLGDIDIDLSGLASPARYEVVLTLEGTDYRNRWGLWVMGEASAADPALPLVESLDEAVLARVASGETLVLAPPPDALKPNAVLGHTAAFWNTLWTSGQAPHTLGLLIEADSRLFEHFPTASHSDWHWWELTHRRRAFDTADVGFAPIVRVIDDWNANRDLMLVAEARVGRGRLILCGADVTTDLDARPVARAFRKALAEYLAVSAGPVPTLDQAMVLGWWKAVSV